MNSLVYQIQYSDEIIGEFDPAFLRYDCRDNPEPDEREVAHMLRFYSEGSWRLSNIRYFGLVSPKFTSKTGISGQTFIDWIDANPGYDVYFINPFPQLIYWHYNVWTQGEFWHPGLSDLANALFDSAGIDVQIQYLPRNTAATVLYSNYWVGNEKFWHEYMTFLNKFVAAIEHLDESSRKKLYELAPHYAPATYFPFIFERLFSTFLILNEEIASLPYIYGFDEILNRCSNDMERFIVREWGGMIDRWDALRRNDLEYRKILLNICGMLMVYQTYHTRDGAEVFSLYDECSGLIAGLKRKLSKFLHC